MTKIRHTAEYQPPPDNCSELVNRTQLATMLGCSRRKTYRLQDIDDNFPKCARDACGTSMWKRKDVLDYIDKLFSK